MFLGLPLSFDPAAFIIAIIALLIAWRAYNIATSFGISLKDVYSFYSHSITNRIVFGIKIQNKGLPIHNMKVNLGFVFKNEDGGNTNCRFDLEKEFEGTFEHGMIMRCELKIKSGIKNEYQMPELNMLKCFLNQKKGFTKPQIIIVSGEHDIYRINLTSKLDFIFNLWNNTSYWINRKFDKHGKFKNGKEWIDPGNVMPTLGFSSWRKLQDFSKMISNQIKS